MERIQDGLFPLGEILATPGALETLNVAGVEAQELLYRHRTGDWGDVDEHDVWENQLAVERGFRIMSAYPVEARGEEIRVWIITEADRYTTTLLLPEEY